VKHFSFAVSPKSVFGYFVLGTLGTRSTCNDIITRRYL